MKEIHKQNIKIVLVGIIALSGVSFASYGASAKGIISALVMLASGVIAIIGEKFGRTDFSKALMITLAPGIATFFYAGVLSGNRLSFLANYAFLAMAAVYFDKKILMCFSVPISVISLVSAIFFPHLIDGPEHSFAGAMTKSVMFILTAAVLVNATKRGRNLIDESEESLDKINGNRTLVMGVAAELDDAIKDCDSGVAELISQADEVSRAAVQMSGVVDKTSEATLSVTEHMSDATDKINENHRLAGKLEQSFSQVNESVTSGNNEAMSLRSNLEGMAETVGEAQKATLSLEKEMDTITNILGEINAIAEQTNLLSLNASIEAARAGEHGRGFAVVADEIRGLSEQSSQASNNIRKILEGLVDITKDVSDKINSGAEAAMSGVEKMGQLMAVFAGIQKSADDATTVVTKEYELIDAVKKEFEGVQREIAGLVKLTEENTDMINHITGSVSQQHQSVEGVQNQIQQLTELSNNLSSHFNTSN